MWIEILRTGQFSDSNGDQHDFSEATLESISRLYNSEVEKDASNLAPLVKGHPKTNSPAEGIIERLARRGKTLLAKVGSLSDEIIDLTRSKRYSKVSVSLHPDLHLRHVGLLGGMSPAVSGLRPVQFSDAEKSFNLTLSKDELTDSTKKQDNLSQAKEKRIAEFRQYTGKLIDSASGAKILPSQASFIVDMLEAAYRRDESMDFADLDDEDRLSEQLKHFLEELPSRLGNSIPMNNSANFSSDFSQANVDAARMKLHAKAMQLRAASPQLSYEEALIKAQENLNL